MKNSENNLFMLICSDSCHKKVVRITDYFFQYLKPIVRNTSLIACSEKSAHCEL